MDFKSFADFPAIHLTQEQLLKIVGGSMEGMSDQEINLETSKMEVSKKIWLKLVEQNPYLLRGALDIIDQYESPSSVVREGLLVGLIMGYALGCAFPPTEEARSKYAESVMKLMDRREHGCDDPNCMACEIRRKMGIYKTKSKVPEVKM